MGAYTGTGAEGVDPALLVATQRLAPGSWSCRSVDGPAFAATLLGFGFDVAGLDLDGVTDKATTIERALAAIEAPEWAGHNWDALYDVLVERFGRDDTSALLVTGAEAIATTVGTALQSLLADAATELAGRGRSFYAVWLPTGPDDTTPAIDDVL